MISLIPYIGTLSFLGQVVFPLTLTLRAINNKDANFGQLVQWCVYWVLFSLTSFLESYVLFFLLDYIPLYLEAKALFFLWLAYPEFQGAGWLWVNVCERPFVSVDHLVMEFVDTKLQSFLSLVSTSDSAASSARGINFKAARDDENTKDT